MLQRSNGSRPRSAVRAGMSLVVGAAMLLAGAAGAAWGQAGQSVKIRFGENSPGTIHTPLYVAVEEGFFKREGLDVEVFVLQGGISAAMAALTSGNINVMTASATDFIQFSARKVISGKMIGEMQDSAFDLVVSKDITSVKQLAGKTIGVSALNAGDQIFIVALLQHFGVSPKDITFIASGNPINRLTAISAGAVQAIAVSNSQRDTSEKVGKILLKSGDSPVKVPNSMIFASSQLLAGNKVILQKFLKALGDASKWTIANPVAAAPHCAKGSGATIEACLATFKVISDPSVAGPYTWSATYGMDVAGTKAALDVVAGFVPEAKNLTIDDVMDVSIVGTTP